MMTPIHSESDRTAMILASGGASAGASGAVAARYDVT